MGKKKRCQHREMANNPESERSTRDWRIERLKAEKGEEAELRISERNDGFRRRTYGRAENLRDLLWRTEETATCDAQKHPDLAADLERMEAKRQARIRRVDRINGSGPGLARWVARRLIRMAWTFRLWLRSTLQNNVRPHEEGYWAETAYDMVDAASSRKSSRAAETHLCEELEGIFKDLDSWQPLDLSSDELKRPRAEFYSQSGRVPQYLLFGALWWDLFKTTDRQLEKNLQVARKARKKAEASAELNELVKLLAAERATTTESLDLRRRALAIECAPGTKSLLGLAKRMAERDPTLGQAAARSWLQRRDPVYKNKIADPALFEQIGAARKSNPKARKGQNSRARS